MTLGGGCVMRIMQLMRSWGRAVLIATSGKKYGGLGGRMAGVGERAGSKQLHCIGVLACYWNTCKEDIIPLHSGE
jgi:transketolase C-terminal domain/subunit